MMKRIFSEHVGAAAVGFGLIGAAIYLLMVTVTLARLEALSGQIPFDMRPLGYGWAEAQSLLDALGAEGRAYYLSRQIPLDTVYPALLALTLICAMCWLGRGQGVVHRRIVFVGIILSLGAGAFDYVENLGIVAMTWSWPQTPAFLVQVTSGATVMKSALTTGAVLLLGVIAILRMCRPKSLMRAG